MGTKWSNLLCVVSVDGVKKLLQLLGCQDSVREIRFELIEGQFAIVWGQKNPHENTWYDVLCSIFHMAAEGFIWMFIADTMKPIKSSWGQTVQS